MMMTAKCYYPSVLVEGVRRPFASLGSCRLRETSMQSVYRHFFHPKHTSLGVSRVPATEGLPMMNKDVVSVSYDGIALVIGLKTEYHT